MRHIGDLLRGVVDEALGLPPDPDDREGKRLVREENIAERERRISLTNRIDDLRYEVNEIGLRLEECGDGQNPLARERDALVRKIETLNRERRADTQYCSAVCRQLAYRRRIVRIEDVSSGRYWEERSA